MGGEPEKVDESGRGRTQRLTVHPLPETEYTPSRGGERGRGLSALRTVEDDGRDRGMPVPCSFVRCLVTTCSGAAPG